MTVAYTGSGRSEGEVLVTDGDSGDHAFIRIHWMRSYVDSNFTVINCGGHQNRITGARVLYQTSDSTYGGKYLQVYVNASSSYDVKTFKMGDDSHFTNLTIMTPIIQNSISGYTVHGNELTELDTYGFAHEEGILAGGLIKSKSGFRVNNSTVINSSGQWVGSSSGLQGAQGAKGNTGSTGGTGAQGAQGAKGSTGSTGGTGATGAQGAKGSTGSTGGTGAQGAKGNTGFYWWNRKYRSTRTKRSARSNRISRNR